MTKIEEPIDLEGTRDQAIPVPAGKFKAQCLQLMENVRRDHHSYLITKRGKPVARLVPIADDTADVLGYMGDTVTIHGDIVAPIDVEWQAEKDADFT